MLEARHLTKKYNGVCKKGFLSTERYEKIAVDNVSLSVEKGKIVGLIGKNGAGKTTTIKMLSTMIEPTRGEVLYDSVNIHDDIKAIRRKINLISGGERSLYWRLTGKENLEYFGRLYDIPEYELKEEIEKIFKLVELEEYKDIPVEKYSKGMKQRLQIARGLINNPDYIFLDEPTLGLDIVIAKELRSYIRKLAELGKGIVLTTHYIQEAEELCDYIYIINDGKIVAEGTPETIKKQYNKQKIWRVSVSELPELLCQKLVEFSDDDNIEFQKEENTLTIKTYDGDISEYVKIICLCGGEIINISALEQTLEDALYKIMKE